VPPLPTNSKGDDMRSEREIRERLEKMMEFYYNLRKPVGYEVCIWSNGFIAALMWVLGEEE